MVIQIFGKVLREFRKEYHLSQARLAELSDLDHTFISELERALRQPTITTIFKLAKGLNIKPSQLIEKVEKEVK